MGDLLSRSPGVTTGFAAFASGSREMTRTCVLPFDTVTTEEAAGINPSGALEPTWDATHAVGTAVNADDRVWESVLAPASRVAGPGRDPVHWGREQPVTPDDPSMGRFLRFLGQDDRARVD